MNFHRREKHLAYMILNHSQRY